MVTDASARLFRAVESQPLDGDPPHPARALETQAFVGHRIGSSDPWIIAQPDLEAFHPNPAGYVAYAEAIRAA